MKNIISSAAGREKADIVLKNGKIIDVLGHRIVEGSVGIKDGIILGIGNYEGEKEIDVKGVYIAPGFVDCHIHIESTMVTPSEFSRLVAPWGVTTVIADPHEIANVAGEKGLKFMLEDSKNSPVDIEFMLPSCVPATPFDDSGAVIDGDLTKELLSKYDFKGLGEMMNSVGVVNCDEDIMKKLDCDCIKDGHAPMLEGKALNAYVCGGISNDHECSNEKEALEKVSAVLNIYIRQGTGAKNLDALISAVTPYNLPHFAFCTDDKHTEEIMKEGTISNCIRLAIEKGFDPISAYTMASYNGAMMNRLYDRGAIAPNRIADIVVTEDISAQNIKYVFKNGQLIASDGKVNFERVSADSKDVTDTVNIKEMTSEDFKKDFDKNEPVIEIETGSLITNAVYAESSQGLSLCANIERYTGKSSMGKCFLRGFTVENGAIAQTIGHDSHNISVIGSDGENMAVAVNALGKEGGIVVVQDKKVIANMPLPIGGLMSDLDYETVAKEQNEIVKGAKKICENGSSTLLMVLAFVSLLVIPHIKLNNRGLFNVDKFEFYKK